MDFRASYDEDIKPDSLLLRNIWRTVDIERTTSNIGGRVGLASVPKQLGSGAIKRMLIRAQVVQGIRHELPNGVRRHEFEFSWLS